MIWDSLLRGLGSILAFLYDVVPSYGVAIILLTVLVRLVLIPLTLRQTRSMHAMQQIQPQIKEIQRKHKGNRQKMNEEMMKLYKEHQVNPLGGCLPLLLQLPVFIALFSVLRSTIGALGVPAEPVSMSAVNPETTVCRPNTDPSVGGETASSVVCDDGTGSSETYNVEAWQDRDSGQEIEAPPSSLFLCRPQAAEDQERDVGAFLCESPLGTEHVPPDSELFRAIVEDRTEFLGIELACSPSQAGSDVGIAQCAGPDAEAGGLGAVPYYLLVALMVATTYYQGKQMQSQTKGPGQQQAQLMNRIMPVFLGFISISISAGVLLYWVTTNAWQIGQQAVILRARAGEAGSGPVPGKEIPPKGSAPQGDGSNVKGSGGRRAGSRKKRRKR
ncbi:MAG TPA: YidC/Oxa1 family membrane protein insertase [Actinomycetota bacterium]|nr:YidC/Oxa1 family membrane protein insertase [Actinomycetota bacterium]